MASNICRTISGARPSEGSSSSSSRGRLISARAIASICCSPPDSVPPRWSMRCFRSGKSAKTRVEVVVELRAGSATVAPICRFSSTVMREKDAAAFRRLRDAKPGDLVGRQSRDVAAVEDDRAFAGARIAADRHHQRRLAGAVGADQRDDLAFVDVEIDALERHDVAVEGLDAAHGEQGALIARPPLRPSRPPRPRRRDRPRSPSDRCGLRPGGPSAILTP